MCSYYITTANKPIATIVNKHQNNYRLYSNNNIYINNNEEFKFHLYNPTTYSYLAIIELNGNKISDSGLIVRPGESIFLERYIDENKKFKFRSYTIQDNPNHENILRNNGLVKIYWYKEYVPVTSCTYAYATGFSGTTNLTTTNLTNLTNYQIPSSNISNFSHKQFLSNDDMNICCINTSNIKTGRIEKGNTSKQKLIREDMTFDSWISYTDEYHLLPIENRPRSRNQSQLIYCECGYRKRRSSWQYCPNCGNEF